MAPGQTAFTEIGAFEAKTRLSEILRKVEGGERFTVTVRGRPVANIVPAQDRTSISRKEALARLGNPPIQGVSGEEILEWIREGRK
jgi:prevent-host-death family protein